MSGCPVCYCSTFKCVYTIFTFARYGNTLLIGGDHKVFIHQWCPDLQRRLKEGQEEKTSDPGAMCGAARPFRVLPEGPGALPLFPKHWKFLPYLQDAGYIRRWLYLPGQPWQDRLYIPDAAAAAPVVRRKEPVRSRGCCSCTYRCWSECRAKRTVRKYPWRTNVVCQKKAKSQPSRFISVPLAFSVMPHGKVVSMPVLK